MNLLDQSLAIEHLRDGGLHYNETYMAHYETGMTVRQFISLEIPATDKLLVITNPLVMSAQQAASVAMFIAKQVLPLVNAPLTRQAYYTAEKFMEGHATEEELKTAYGYTHIAALDPDLLGSWPNIDVIDWAVTCVHNNMIRGLDSPKTRALLATEIVRRIIRYIGPVYTIKRNAKLAEISRLTLNFALTLIDEPTYARKAQDSPNHAPLQIIKILTNREVDRLIDKLDPGSHHITDGGAMVAKCQGKEIQFSDPDNSVTKIILDGHVVAELLPEEATYLWSSLGAWAEQHKQNQQAIKIFQEMIK